MSSVEETPVHSIYMESPLKAVVGERKTTFYVHPGALIQGKSALTARVTGPWKFAGQDLLDWSDFDEETISCVLEFCYSQKYTTPWELHPSKKKSVLQEPTKSSTEHMLLDATSSSSPTSRSYTGDAIVLHAKVYSFAQRYLVMDLQDYARVLMKDAFGPFLKEYGSSPYATSGSLADTIRIIYGSTLLSSDLARKDLCDFIAASHEKFRNDFADFQEDTGDFMSDLASTLSQLLSSKDAINREYQRKDAESRAQKKVAKPENTLNTTSPFGFTTTSFTPNDGLFGRARYA
ncbi:hypothetical protein CBS147332_3146 [Penicillium roqueforti]|nr:hypothetical protein CBS147332_3146 [Penicillium roqueforti]KAI3125567.1 hypothetical protein CBS147331_561 [Penicillium roqueforti]